MRWGQALERPRALLVVSAHWTVGGPTIGSVTRRQLIYDFHGFPQALYKISYDAPGAPELAKRVEALVGQSRVRRQEDRGLDHGVWVPLVHLFPSADVPVLQLSLPIQQSPQQLFDLGRRLAPLRGEGVLIAGSGNLTHNLRRMDPRSGPTPNWAREFDEWCRECLDTKNFDALVQFRTKAPAVRENHPTEEHFLPLLVSTGAASAGAHTATFPVQGFEYGCLSRRSVQLG